MDNLRLLQIALLDLALEVRRICDRNKIPYSLCGGSLLGAVRHGGFIPWDDDMDIAMLRADYDNFLRVCRHELDNSYILQTHELDPQYANSFAKIGIRGTTLLNPLIKNDETGQCVSIDIFPLDTIPHSRWKQRWQYFVEQNFCAAAYMKAGYIVDLPVSIAGKVRRKMVHWYARKHTLQEILIAQTCWEKRNHDTDKTEVGVVFFRESYSHKNDFLDLIPVNFEGYEFPIPRSFDLILKGIYGDYKKLPPENKRITHNFTKFDLSQYRIKNVCFEEINANAK